MFYPLNLYAMKCRLLLVAVALMLLSSTSYAKPRAKTLTAEHQVRMVQIDARIHEIKAMDLASLSRQERKALRKEVIQLKKEATGIATGGVYLSVAAIIILLVLILIL